MKRILVIILFLFSSAAVFADEITDSANNITSQSNRLFYESRKSTINSYRQKVGDISRDTTFAQNLIDFAIHCYTIGEYGEAIQAMTEAANIYSEVYGKDSPKYAMVLGIQAYSYSNFGNYSEAIRLGIEAMEIIKRKLGTEHPDYASLLGNQAGYYSDLSNYSEAIRLGTEAMEIFKRTIGTNNLKYAMSLNNLANYYSDLGNYSEAIRLGTEAMEIRKRILRKDHPYYAMSLGNLANYYSDIGNYSEAIRLGTEAMEIRKRVLGTDHPDYATSLGNLANYYSKLGNYSEAIRLGTEAMEIRKIILRKDHPYYAWSLSSLSSYYLDIGNCHEAIRLETEALEIRKRELGPKHPDYATSLCNLAVYYSRIGHYSKAIRLGTEAMEIRKRVLGTDHPDYASSLNNLATYYDELGYDDEAIRLGTEVMEIRKRVLGTDHPDYAMSLSNLLGYYSALGYYDESIRLSNAYVQGVRKNILGVFSGLTSNERQMYWNKFRYSFNEKMPRVIIHSEAPNTSSLLYDNITLFSKGLLLSTELEISKLIQESGDEEAEQMYSQLRQNRQILNFQYSKPIAERSINCDSLERVSTALERTLSSRVQEFGDYTRNLSITWKDVQSKLDDSDIAIEFLSYPEYGGSMYVALTLCKNDTAPLLTPLFTELQLKDVAGEDSTYQNAAADSLIWGPLASRLEGKSRIYFSPAGLMHRIGIEYLPSMEGKHCYRLSSTRELVTHKPSEGIKSATLFGGIDYDATYASIKSSAPSSTPGDPNDPGTVYYAENTESGPIIYKQGGRGGLDEYNSMRTMRYSVRPLSGSRKEIQAVSALLKKSVFNVQDCDTITRNQASEESFKALSGQRRSLIHISTHGFYYDTIAAKHKGEHLRFKLMGDDMPSRSEDKSLLRCGLCFAGANQFLREKNNPAEGQDEGILNALEIAQTDLRGLDLVVLSACQTALGDVVNGEGVFGLQRGFKKAGAKSILMSLWIVDDDITALLMTEFYKAWTSSPEVTKTAALKAAQDVVKEKYPNPNAWAGFILLDALD